MSDCLVINKRHFIGVKQILLVDNYQDPSGLCDTCLSSYLPGSSFGEAQGLASMQYPALHDHLFPTRL